MARQVSKAGAIVSVACAFVAACAVPPTAPEGQPEGRTVMVEPKRVDLPAGADPDFDQADPQGITKEHQAILEQLKKKLATESAETSAPQGDVKPGESKGEGEAKLADPSGLMDTLKNLEIPDIGELLKKVASASADLGTW